MTERQEWSRDPDYRDYFFKIGKFNSTYYRIEINIQDNIKSVKYWVALSSGKKRRMLDVFEEDGKTRDGGLKALSWVKKEMLNFPNWYRNNFNIEDNPKEYICISWTDSRRREVYARLKKEGFEFRVDQNKKVLRKKL